MADPVATFFRACEEGASRARPDPTGGATAEQPSWLRDLAAATAAELAFDTTRARELLERARLDVPEGAFRNVLALLELRSSSLPTMQKTTATTHACGSASAMRIVARCTRTTRCG